jgi:hypothetical protein
VRHSKIGPPMSQLGDPRSCYVAQVPKPAVSRRSIGIAKKRSLLDDLVGLRWPYVR